MIKGLYLLEVAIGLPGASSSNTLLVSVIGLSFLSSVADSLLLVYLFICSFKENS